MSKIKLTETEKELIYEDQFAIATRSIQRRCNIEPEKAAEAVNVYIEDLYINAKQEMIDELKGRNSRKIKTLQQLRDLALQRKAVVCPSVESWRKPKAAAFMLGLQVWYALDLLEKGLFVYEKREGK
jgi:hypothetical protein